MYALTCSCCFCSESNSEITSDIKYPSVLTSRIYGHRDTCHHSVTFHVVNLLTSVLFLLPASTVLLKRKTHAVSVDWDLTARWFLQVWKMEIKVVLLHVEGRFYGNNIQQIPVNSASRRHYFIRYVL